MSRNLFSLVVENLNVLGSSGNFEGYLRKIRIFMVGLGFWGDSVRAITGQFGLKLLEL